MKFRKSLYIFFQTLLTNITMHLSNEGVFFYNINLFFKNVNILQRDNTYYCDLRSEAFFNDLIKKKRFTLGTKK